MSEEEMLTILENYFEIIKDIPLIECGDIAMILATQEMLKKYKHQQKEIERLKSYIKENEIYKSNLFQYSEEQQKELQLKDKVIQEIKNEIREHIGFENRLKKDGIEPDLFNQGRFYVANNIKEIINKVKGE